MNKDDFFADDSSNLKDTSLHSKVGVGEQIEPFKDEDGSELNQNEIV